MPESTRQPGRRAGYTLVELAITVLIMGILAAVAAPRYQQASNRFRVEAAAKRIAADLNFVRAKAVSTGVIQGGNFYADTDKYWMIGDPDIDRPSAEYWVDLSQTSYPVDLVSATFTNGNGYTSDTRFGYLMYGRAHTGNPPGVPDAPITSGQIVVQSGAEQRTVVINAVTGEASVP